MECFDSLPQMPALDFDAYIGDLGLSCTGKAKAVIRALVAGARSLHVGILEVLSCKLAILSCKFALLSSKFHLLVVSLHIRVVSLHFRVVSFRFEL